MYFGSQAFWLSKKWVQPGGLEVRDSIFFPYPGVACSLLVSIGADTSRGGGVSLPGSYKINAPGQGDTMAVGDVTISWSPAQFATWYDLSLHYHAVNVGEGDTVVILSSPSVVIPLSFFQRDSTTRFWVIQISVQAHGGDVPGVGKSGSLIGKTKGVFYSTFVDTGASRQFYMGHFRAEVKKVQPGQSNEAKRRQAILRAFGVPVKSF
jgi:hypothetical protein